MDLGLLGNNLHAPAFLTFAAGMLARFARSDLVFPEPLTQAHPGPEHLLAVRHRPQRRSSVRVGLRFRGLVCIAVVAVTCSGDGSLIQPIIAEVMLNAGRTALAALSSICIGAALVIATAALSEHMPNYSPPKQVGHQVAKP